MAILVTLEQAKQHLRLTYTDLKTGSIASDDSEDSLIEGYIEAASDYIVNYCEQSFQSSVPASVKHACLLLVGDFYKEREETITGTVSPTKTVERLLAPYRKNMRVY